MDKLALVNCISKTRKHIDEIAKEAEIYYRNGSFGRGGDEVGLTAVRVNKEITNLLPILDSLYRDLGEIYYQELANA